MGLFEIHFHDSEFKPSMHIGSNDDETGHEEVESTDEPMRSGRSVLLAVVAALAALAVGAVVVKKGRR